MVTIKGDGLTMEDVRAFHAREVFPANMKVLDSVITAEVIEDDVGEGSYALYQHIKTPLVVSNRCNFLAIHQIELENGGFIHMSTGKGMKPIEQANQQRIGKDVLAHCVVTF